MPKNAKTYAFQLFNSIGNGCKLVDNLSVKESSK